MSDERVEAIDGAMTVVAERVMETVGGRAGSDVSVREKGLALLVISITMELKAIVADRIG